MYKGCGSHILFAALLKVPYESVTSKSHVELLAAVGNQYLRQVLIGNFLRNRMFHIKPLVPEGYGQVVCFV